jgi:hypothetical protein
MTKIAGSGSESGSSSISQRLGSADPDPYQNVMDLQDWFILLPSSLCACKIYILLPFDILSLYYVYSTSLMFSDKKMGEFLLLYRT